MRRNKKFYDEYSQLDRAGWNLQKQNNVQPNSGSETNAHWITKCLVARVLMLEGYAVASEVAHPDYGEIDVLAYAHEDRLTYAVECETSPTDEVVQDKLERYVHSNNVVDDMLLLNVSDCPVDRIEAEAWVREELGL